MPFEQSGRADAFRTWNRANRRGRTEGVDRNESGLLGVQSRESARSTMVPLNGGRGIAAIQVLGLSRAMGAGESQRSVVLQEQQNGLTILRGNGRCVSAIGQRQDGQKRHEQNQIDFAALQPGQGADGVHLQGIAEDYTSAPHSDEATGAGFCPNSTPSSQNVQAKECQVIVRRLSLSPGRYSRLE